MYPWSECNWRISPFEWMEDKKVENMKYVAQTRSRCAAATTIIGLSSLNLVEYVMSVRQEDFQPLMSTH